MGRPLWLERASKTATLVVTNCIKIAGVYVGVKGATVPHPEASVLAFAGFMMAGAQVSETVVLAFLERFFGSK